MKPNYYLSKVSGGDQVFLDPETMEIDQEWTGIFGITRESLVRDLEGGMLFHILAKPWIHTDSYIESIVSMMKEAGVSLVYSLGGVQYELIPSRKITVLGLKELMKPGKEYWYSGVQVIKEVA